MDERERQAKLEEAVRDAVAIEQARQAADQAAALKPERRRQWGLVGVLLVSWGVMAWIWVARPEFIFGPQGPAAVSAARREASLRFGLALVRIRIDEHFTTTGRLPASLQAMSDSSNDITWERGDSGYTLIGRDSSLLLRLTDRMSVDSFLGRSLQILRSDR